MPNIPKAAQAALDSGAMTWDQWKQLEPKYAQMREIKRKRKEALAKADAPFVAQMETLQSEVEAILNPPAPEAGETGE